MSVTENLHVGRPTSRVNGPLKVTGQAKYAAEYLAAGLLHGYIVDSTIAAGRIIAIDLHRARLVPGVVEIFTHENRGKAAWLDRKWRDEVALPGDVPTAAFRLNPVRRPTGSPDHRGHLRAARDAASLVTVDYDVEEHCTELARKLAKAYVPPKKRSGIPPPPDPRGDAEKAFADAPIEISGDDRINAEHHNPMEMFGTTCVLKGPASPPSTTRRRARRTRKDT